MFISGKDIGRLEEIVDGMALDTDESLMMLIAEHAPLKMPDMIEAMNQKGINCFGGIFPQLIHGDVCSEDGIILKRLRLIESLIRVRIGDDAWESRNKPLAFGSLKDRPTAYIFLDGLSPHVSALLSEVYNHYGNEVHFIGAGAGSAAMKQCDCIFDNSGVYRDALIIGITADYCQPGVRHGWQRIEGPVVASRASGNTIRELNWQPAYDAYLEVVQRHSARELKQESFFEWAKAYPFGISKEDCEDIVRDPIRTGDGGELDCVGEVPENALLYYLNGSADRLIRAAAKAVQAGAAQGRGMPKDCLVVDCISRVLFLEADFQQELTIIKDNLEKLRPDMEVEGILSIGEIATYDGLVELLNKTVVVGVIYGE